MNNEEKLIKMLKYVSEHNDFYKNRIKEYGITNPLDITQWPILTRKELQENRYNMFSDGYKTKYFNQQLRRQSSSGSTGVPINVYWDYKDWYASIKTLWRKRFEHYGINPRDKCVKFTLRLFDSSTENDKVDYVINKNILSFNASKINDKSLLTVLKLINEFRPRWLYATPYILQKIMCGYKKYNLIQPISVKYIESVGEILFPDVREQLSDFFNVPIVNMYGSEEFNAIAYECPNGILHLLDEIVFVECYDIKREGHICEGKTMITGLLNRAMPLLRYDLGDVISLEDIDSCRVCGLSGKVIDVVKGRSCDCVSVEYEKYIYDFNIYSMREIIDIVNNRFKDIIVYYRFSYIKSKSVIECKVFLSNPDWYQTVNMIMKKLFFSKFGATDVGFEVKMTDFFPSNVLKDTQFVVLE